MAITETYKKRLLANYNSLLLILGMKTNSTDISVYDFLIDSKSKFRYYYSDKKSFKNNRIRLESSVAELAKVSDSATFSYISILDFTPYERIDYLLELILEYQDINSVTSYMDDEIKRLIEYITLLESTNGSVYKNTLSYMTIRNFLMLLVNKHFLHASIYANFIKEQIFLSEGLSPKMKFTDIYKGELGLSIKKERSRYSNKIRRILKNQVTSIIKNSSDSKINDNIKDSNKTSNNYKTSDDNYKTSNESKDAYYDNSPEDNQDNDSKVENFHRVFKIKGGNENKNLDYKGFKREIYLMIHNRMKINNSSNETVEEIDEKINPSEPKKSKFYSDIVLNNDNDEVVDRKKRSRSRSKIFDEDGVMDEEFVVLDDE